MSLRFEDYHPGEYDAHVQELKLAALDGIEAEWRAEQERIKNDMGTGGGTYYSSYSSWMNYGTSLIGKKNKRISLST